MISSLFLLQDESEDEADEQNGGDNADGEPITPGHRRSFEKEESHTTLPEVLQAVEASSSRKLFDDLLTKYYVTLETWYMRTIIDKASLRFFFELCCSNVLKSYM